MVCEEFKKIDCGIRYDNISREQRLAIKDLQHMEDVVIKPADKGANIIIWSTKLYEREALRQLRDTTCYKKLTFNATIKFKNELHMIVSAVVEKGIITETQSKSLIREYP